jgi:hypothetical protein
VGPLLRAKRAPEARRLDVKPATPAAPPAGAPFLKTPGDI